MIFPKIALNGRDLTRKGKSSNPLEIKIDSILIIDIGMCIHEERKHYQY